MNDGNSMGKYYLTVAIQPGGEVILSDMALKHGFVCRASRRAGRGSISKLLDALARGEYVLAKVKDTRNG